MSASPSPSASDVALRLTRPLICLDLETTGVHQRVDRIVQIGLIKIYTDGRETQWKTLVNPTILIPADARAVHGITDDMVADAPTFRDIGPKLARGLQDCDITGFNVKFDIGFLLEEFRRIGVQLVPGLLDGAIVDSFRIFQAKERRDLETAVSFYLGEKIIDAHDALIDARYALRVLEAQRERYQLPDTVDELVKVFEKPGDAYDGKIVTKDGLLCLNFGKWAGTPLKQIERGYREWMLKKDFPPAVKRAIQESLK